MNVCPTDHLQLAPKVSQACGGLQASRLFWEKHRDVGVRRVETTPEDCSPCLQRGL